MTYWASYFDPAGPTWDAFTTDGEICAEDILTTRIKELLLLDAKLVEIFQTRIEVMDARPVQDFRIFPRLQIYLFSSSEDQSPTTLDVTEVSIYIAIRWDARKNEVVDQYGASVASVRKQVAFAMKNRKSLHVVINSVEVPIAWNMTTGDTNYDVEEETGGDRIAAILETEWICRTDVSHTSQRIVNIERALP